MVISTKLSEPKYKCAAINQGGCGKLMSITYDDIIASKGYTCEHCGYTAKVQNVVLRDAEKNRKAIGTHQCRFCSKRVANDIKSMQQHDKRCGVERRNWQVKEQPIKIEKEKNAIRSLSVALTALKGNLAIRKEEVKRLEKEIAEHEEKMREQKELIDKRMKHNRNHKIKSMVQKKLTVRSVKTDK